ncbi:hypothetical protein [Roseisolibacter agri]|uniref:SPOR domain-containing protein n=1 Tax=Roseisolibacter agri TaxID=2014610 RepID=A0AA37Q4C5_9BACT|nr:hypothetical protein [Roseisolibacter agri]GLC26344.1 hypothetical protein rosag_28570 [Roseisolibacter agri]
MTESAAGTLPVWHDEGRRVASALDAVGSALVVGRDPEIAAWVALGIARAQAEQRRVAVADLVGEVAPLQALVDRDEDPHGISDSFLYGVSLNKIARPADAAGNLFVLPSGSEAVAVEEIFRSDRWRRLASGFREVGALLLLVAHADTPGLDALATSVDGVVLAGDASGALPDAAPPLAVVGAPTRRPRPSVGRAIGGAKDARDVREARESRADAAESETIADGTRTPPNRLAAYVVAAVALLALVAAGVLFARQRARGDAGPRMAAAVSDSARRAAADSARAAAAPPPPDTLPSLAVENAADTVDRAMYTVQTNSASTETSVQLPANVDRATLPAQVIAPVLLENRPWFYAYVGAFRTREEAEALRDSLASRRVLGDESGVVERTPFAFLIADSVPAAQAPRRIAELERRDIPSYPLARGNGLVALYSGAFRTQDEAAFHARTLQSAGIRPRLVYRTGRSL